MQTGIKIICQTYQEIVPFNALGVLPAIARAMIAMMAIAITMMRHIKSLSV